MEVLDLKSSETKEYNSENKAEKKGIADSILNKNADTDLAAPLLEPSQNEGVMLSEDSSKEESKYVVIDIVQQSEYEVDSSKGCCSCFSFFIPTGNCFKLFRNFGRKCEAGISSTSCDYHLAPSNSVSFGDDLINEFKRPVKQVDLPRPKGS